ncbi:MAG: homoserine dehydrogenase [Anaerolineaceae bacterium]|nr:homoserine dehydrogenase [Anaerolineaceae bacterium]
MKMYRLALIGFGNVGQGFVQILRDYGETITTETGASFRIVAICDALKGSIYQPEGYDPAELLDVVQKNGKLESLPAKARNMDAIQTIVVSNADVVVEMSFTDLKTGQPAIQYVDAAIKNKKHVVTTNKGPAALAYQELAEQARLYGVKFGVEGTVMSGTPALGLATQLLQGAGINKIQGILNGTTNYMLTKMAEGASYEDVLQEAQSLGYAEADPSGDVEGHDAAGKVVILAAMLMDAEIKLSDIDLEGITKITPADIELAAQHNEKWKLIGALEKKDGQIFASVKPTRVPLSHPLAGVDGATNAITYSTDLLGDVTLIGAGAGRMETGFAVLGDLLGIHRTLQ